MGADGTSRRYRTRLTGLSFFIFRVSFFYHIIEIQEYRKSYPSVGPSFFISPPSFLIPVREAMFPPFHGCGDRKGICLSLFLDKTGGASAPARSENFAPSTAVALGFPCFWIKQEASRHRRGVKTLPLLRRLRSAFPVFG